MLSSIIMLMSLDCEKLLEAAQLYRCAEDLRPVVAECEQKAVRVRGMAACKQKKAAAAADNEKAAVLLGIAEQYMELAEKNRDTMRLYLETSHEMLLVAKQQQPKYAYKICHWQNSESFCMYKVCPSSVLQAAA